MRNMNNTKKINVTETIRIVTIQEANEEVRQSCESVCKKVIPIKFTNFTEFLAQCPFYVGQNVQFLKVLHNEKVDYWIL